MPLVHVMCNRSVSKFMFSHTWNILTNTLFWYTETERGTGP